MTSPKKWQDSWFLSLPPNLKLLWVWITDNCNLAGVLPDGIEWNQVGKQVGVNAPKTALASFAGRLECHHSGKMIVLGFARFQNDGRSLAQKPNAQIEYLLSEAGLTEDDVTPKTVLPTQAVLDCMAGEDEATKDKANELKKRICLWFNRRESTKWTAKEMKALKLVASLHTDIADFEALDRYYMATMPADSDYRRRDVLTLLNNWNGEVDRAKQWVPEKKVQQVRL